ncbi:MAG: MDR family MFS transporter [Tepidiformaceae bacterium]
MVSDDSRPLGEILDSRQRWLLVFSLMIAMFVGALDQTIVATATPSILADLGGFGLLSWLFTSYILASTVVIPLVGKLSDIYGRKLFLLAGIIIFTVSSAACGAAPTIISLIAFRAVQGIGGGMIFASVFSTIGDIFPPAERGKYIGLFTGTFSLASILGPTVGGFLTDSFDWRWVFYINIPFAAIAIPAIWINLPTRRAVRRPKIDFVGATLLSISSVLLLFALVWAGDKYPWVSPQIVSLIAGSAVFAGVFVLQESRHPEPMMPLHLFRNRVFVLSNVIVFLLGMGMFGVIPYLPTFVQTALGASATASGVITTPQSLGVLVASILGGQLIARTGRYRVLTISGGVIITVCMVGLSKLGVNTPELRISLIMVVLGVGFGMVLPTMSLVIQNAVPYEYLGVATSSSQFFRQIGTVLGTAIFGAILASSYQSALVEQMPAADRAAIPAATLQQFDDPTLALDSNKFNQVKTEILAVSASDGQRLVDSAVGAQREAVAIATRRIFSLALIIAALSVVVSFFMKELPLRRDFKPSDEGMVFEDELPRESFPSLDGAEPASGGG